MKSYYIQTDRLLLRDWLEEDIDGLAKINADEKVMEFFPSVRGLKETKAGVARMSNHFNQHGFGMFAVDRIDTNEFIGYIGIAYVPYETDFTPCVEIGWRLGYNHWGYGFATEGAKACIDFGFNTLGLKEIVSFTAVPNVRSENVMKKIGMQHIGEFDHPKIDKGHPLERHLLYSISR